MDLDRPISDTREPSRGHFLDDLDPTSPFSLEDAGRAVSRLEGLITNLSEEEAEGRRLVGLDGLVRRLVQAVLIGEHCLIEGAPGLAKTLAAKTLSTVLGLSFQRIQFVPDLMPSDLVQRERLDIDGSGKAVIQWIPGPVFTNLLLADEINRASPKAQAALLEVTEERQVTSLYRRRTVVRPREPIDESKLLERYGPYFGEQRIDPEGRRGQVFVTLATMNPIEQEGVYPLSEAQLDRFAFHVILDYPDGDDLEAIAAHAFESAEETGEVGRHDPERHVKTLYFLARLRRLMLGRTARDHWMRASNADPRRRVVDLIDFSHLRLPAELGIEDSWRGAFGSDEPAGSKAWRLRRTLKRWQGSGDPALGDHATRLIARVKDRDYPEVGSGSSPRGLLKLIRASHAEALLNGHLDPDGLDVPEPTWDDIRSVAHDVLRHRVRLSSTAAALGARPDRVISELLRWVEGRPTTIA